MSTLAKNIEKKGILTDKLVGPCYDNAPNMGGAHKGVQSCISNHLHREIIHIPCGVHTSNLSVEHASHCSVEYTSLLMLLRELYNPFTASSKRYHIFRTELDVSPYGLTVKSLSGTRWTANYESIHSVIESYDVIIFCLESIHEDFII